MNILMISWRGPSNPKAGGAEVLTLGILKELIRRGHTVTWFTAADGATDNLPEQNSIHYEKGGNAITVLWYAYKYYKKNGGRFDIVVDQINALPFLTPLYVPKKKRRMFIHQLARETWWYEAPLPPIGSIIGYILEPLMLALYRYTKSITVSESTKQGLQKYGIKDITIIRQAIHTTSRWNIQKQFETPTIIHVGRIVPMKRINHCIRAIASVKESIPNIKLLIVGKGSPKYQEELQQLIHFLGLEDNVEFTGFVSQKRKEQLMAQAHCLITTSVREGWGLIITEANSFGTPAISYNIPGTRDAIKNNKTGKVTAKNTPNELAKEIIELLENHEKLEQMSKAALEDAKYYTNWEKTTDEFEHVLQH